MGQRILISHLSINCRKCRLAWQHTSHPSTVLQGYHFQQRNFTCTHLKKDYLISSTINLWTVRNLARTERKVEVFDHPHACLPFEKKGTTTTVMCTIIHPKRTFCTRIIPMRSTAVVAVLLLYLLYLTEASFVATETPTKNRRTMPSLYHRCSEPMLPTSISSLQMTLPRPINGCHRHPRRLLLLSLRRSSGRLLASSSNNNNNVDDNNLIVISDRSNVTFATQPAPPPPTSLASSRGSSSSLLSEGADREGNGGNDISNNASVRLENDDVAKLTDELCHDDSKTGEEQDPFLQRQGRSLSSSIQRLIDEIPFGYLFRGREGREKLPPIIVEDTNVLFYDVFLIVNLSLSISMWVTHRLDATYLPFAFNEGCFFASLWILAGLYHGSFLYSAVDGHYDPMSNSEKSGPKAAAALAFNTYINAINLRLLAALIGAWVQHRQVGLIINGGDAMEQLIPLEMTCGIVLMPLWRALHSSYTPRI